jgi:3-oxoacyl-[acyl-carrier protein] reductase
MKKALVTGGAGDIGMSISRRLLKEGYQVFIYDLISSGGVEKAETLNSEFGADRTVFIAGDLSNLEVLPGQMENLIAEHGYFEVLVNNAAIDTMGSLEETSVEEFLRTQRINSESAYILSRAIAPGMKSAGAGQIVNIMSIILSGGWENRAPYAMSKGALLGLTRSLARELGPFNIRVNAVSPGAIPTALERKFWEDDRSALDAVILEKQSLKFRAEVEDVANAVWFLVSPESRFITGHELHVNGGWYMG